MIKVAALQMNTGACVKDNLQQAKQLIEKAAKEGAKLLVLPEMFSQMGVSLEQRLQAREEEGSGPIQDFLAKMSKDYGVWLVAGTIYMKGVDAKRGRAACLIYNDQGKKVARYDKIHLFDANLTDVNENYLESSYTEPGDEIIVVDTPFAKIGIAVCYDMRFPELFVQLAKEHVEILVIPAAFTKATGVAHWDILTRARAIESFCYVIASAQTGQHADGRETYGHSMVIDPWGCIMDVLPQGIGIVAVDVDIDYLHKVRQGVPVYQHRRIN